MAKLRLPKHLRALNPDLPAEVEGPRDRRPFGATLDKRGEFGYWWRLMSGAPEGAYPGGWILAEGLKFGRWEFDWAFPDFYVAVEVDGGQHAQGGGRHATDSDRWKLNEAAAAGWLVLRFSPEMLTADPGRCVNQVGRALRGRVSHAW